MDDLFGVFDDQSSKAQSEATSPPAPRPDKSSKRKNKKRKAEALGHGDSHGDDANVANSASIAPSATLDGLDGEEHSDGNSMQSRQEKNKDQDIEMMDAPASDVMDDGENQEADEEESTSQSQMEVKEDGDKDRHSNGGSDSKRRRNNAGALAGPLLTDTFETAQSREVAAAGGFAPGQEESSLVLSHNIQHQVALPPDLDYEYVPLSEHKPSAKPAREYAFTLDPFQRLSISSIERGESVLVSAHTSAGKTVVAEYAIARCLQLNTRVIYTSPIKALSNQKYREFNESFGDVGLMTGDVTINPTASCLVMTTEILRSMLYRGSEIMREVAWVVFDEVHYMRDKSRGVVWEETIILLPNKVRYVFLSATIPNAFQFAEWIAKIHHQACHVVYTDFRPTPLQNYFFPAGGKGLYLVVDEKSVFRENNFNKCMQDIEDRKTAEANDPDARSKGKGGKGGKTKKPMRGNKEEANADIQNIVKMIMRKVYNPVIVFNFSKRECEMMALFVSKFAFNDDSEKAMVRKVFNSAIECLSEEDSQLPQITNILPLLEKGIGVHHSGLLPILKETIEILFQEGLIKVLFATETFSIGLNMPAKTVVFTQVTKWDGVARRPLTSAEYIQMAGRAGRRGLDERGIVIMMIDDKLEPDVAKDIVVGQQDKMNSAFHLSYNMILNLLRIEGISPEYMLENCFYQFQNSASVAGLEQDLMRLQKERDTMVIPDEAIIKDYHSLRQQIESYTQDMVAVIQLPEHCLEYLQPGRIVQIHNPKTNQDFGWGVIAACTERKKPRNAGEEYPKQESYFVDVFIDVDPKSGFIEPFINPAAAMPDGIRPLDDPSTSSFQCIPCLLTCIKALGQLRVFMPKDIKTREDVEETRRQIQRSLSEVQRRFPDGFPVLDPIENMGITDEAFKKLLRKIEVLESRLLANPLHGSPLLSGLWDQYSHKLALSDQTKALKKKIAKAHSIAQMDELKARKRVLRRLGFTNDADVVQMKARVACEISSTEGHELLLAELLFDGFFNDLTPDIAAAVLSCCIFEEKVESADMREDLRRLFGKVQGQARTIAKVAVESKVEGGGEEEYLKTLKPQLMETVLAWAGGRSFAEVTKMSDVFEGSLIRLFRRLEELLRQMAQAAKVMGSEELTQKFDEGLSKIRRGVVAAQSLYL